MKKIVFQDYKELSIETAKLIARIIAGKPDALLCFPAGETSVGTFDALIQMHKNGIISFNKCKVVGLDEWVHLGEMQNENCYHFLKKHLFDHMDMNPENLCFFNGESNDLRKECLLTDQFIKANGGIDMMLLGVGMNGHLGLNEPGISFDNYSHIVELDSVTKRVGQKYFSARAELTKGITLGMKHIFEAKTVILQISGKKKSPVVKRLLEEEVSTELPSSLLKKHPNTFLLLDADAASKEE